MTIDDLWRYYCESKSTNWNILTLQFLVLWSGPQLMHHFESFFGVIRKRLVTKGLIIWFIWHLGTARWWVCHLKKTGRCHIIIIINIIHSASWKWELIARSTCEGESFLSREHVYYVAQCHKYFPIHCSH